jgi:hypothetical protein
VSPRTALYYTEGTALYWNVELCPSTLAGRSLQYMSGVPVTKPTCTPSTLPPLLPQSLQAVSSSDAASIMEELEVIETEANMVLWEWEWVREGEGECGLGTLCNRVGGPQRD